MSSPPANIPIARRMVFLGCAILLLGGCIELGLLPPPDGNGGDPPNGNGGNGGTPVEEVPRVRLTASNVAPQANEQVILRCILTNDPMGDVVFDFQATGGVDGRLQVNPTAGTATFIVDETDVGIAVTVTCTGTNELGTGPPSSAQTIVATSPEPPFPEPVP